MRGSKKISQFFFDPTPLLSTGNCKNSDFIEEHLLLGIQNLGYTDGLELRHGKIEIQSYRIYDGLDITTDRERWSQNNKEIHRCPNFGNTSVCEQPVCGHTALGLHSTRPLVHKSMHWLLDRNLVQDRVRRKYPGSARNLDTIQSMVYSLFSIWKGRRKKQSNKSKGMAELMRHVSMGFTRLKRFLSQECKKRF